MSLSVLKYIYSVVLVGMVQVKTKGEGMETYSAPEEEWITVKSGDRLGIFEPSKGGGGVPYDNCNGGN